jgi:hypothetical protein
MASIAAYVVVVAIPLLIVYLFFLAVVREVRDEHDYEVEVKLCPPSIRRKVQRDRSYLTVETVQREDERNNRFTRSVAGRADIDNRGPLSVSERHEQTSETISQDITRSNSH